VVNIFRWNECPVSLRNGIRPAMRLLASEAFSGWIEKFTVSDQNCLSIVWNSVVLGLCSGMIPIRT